MILINLNVMKKNDIEDTVETDFNNIERSLHNVLIHFSIDDIQQFRMEVKTLRSFFHLLDMEAGGDTRFMITPKMKTFYGYVGIIRNLDLFLQAINSRFEYSTDKDVMAFIKKLEKEIIYWEKTAKEFIGPVENFRMDEDNLLSRLPSRLRTRSIKKYAQFLNYEIQTLLTRFTDERINSIRKLLEDILYNWNVLQPFASTFPKGMQKLDEINSLVKDLSVFKDKCAAYTVLDVYYNDSESDDEKIVLAEIIQVYKTEKDEIKKPICSKLEFIPVQPIVKRAFSL